MNIINLRLQNQQLVNTKFSDPAKLVKYMGAIQSQDYEPGKWSIGLRTKGATSKSIEEEINKGNIIRTWPMRGTLHFVHPTDAKWMVKSLTPRVMRKMASYFKKLELDDKVFNKAQDVVIKEISGGKSIARNELTKLWNENGIETKNMRGMFIVGKLAADGLICFGPKNEKQPTFVLMDEWIKKSDNFEGDDAIAEIALRYFTSHGPAQVIDLMWWSGLTKSEAVRGVEILKDKLLVNTDGDRTFYTAKELPDEVKLEDRIELLQAYDEFTISYKDRSDMAGSAGYVPEIKINDGFYAMIILNGKIIGSWRREIIKNKIQIQTRIEQKLSSKEKDLLQDATDRFGRFHNLETEIK